MASVDQVRLRAFRVGASGSFSSILAIAAGGFPFRLNYVHPIRILRYAFCAYNQKERQGLPFCLFLNNELTGLGTRNYVPICVKIVVGKHGIIGAVTYRAVCVVYFAGFCIIRLITEIKIAP